MKILQEESFKPITIVLETQEEVNILAAMYGVSGSVAKAVCNATLRKDVVHSKITDFLNQLGREGINEASNNF